MLALLLSLCSALALDVPAYAPGERVFVVPPAAMPSVERTRAAASRATWPVYVVVYEEVITGLTPDFGASHTESAIEATWAAWAAQPGSGPQRFDRMEGSLIVLGLDEREVRLKAGERWDAELGLGGSALLPLIDDAFMPWAVAGNLDQGLAALAVAMDGAVEDRLAAKARAEALARWLRWLPLVLVVGFSAVGSLTLLFLMWARAFRARRAFQRVFTDRMERIEHARDRLATLNLDVELRDRVVALKIKGRRTREVADEVVARLSALHDGIATLHRRYRRIRDDLRPLPLQASPYHAAEDALDAPFEVDTGEVQDRLFDTPTRVERVDPRGFMEQLDGEWEAVRHLWARVGDAVEASLRQAREDLPGEWFDALRDALADAALPAAWVAEHPLAAAPDALWTALDRQRKEDPVAYLDALDARIAEHEALAERVATLVSAQAAVRDARAAADAESLDGLDTIVRDPAREPGALARRAAAAEERMEAALRAATDFEAVRIAEDEALEALEALRVVRAQVRDAVPRAESAVADASARLAALGDELAQARARVRAMLEAHDASSLAAAWTELTEANVDADEAEDALAEARGALAARAHLEAVEHVARALDEKRQALTNLQELGAVLAHLEAKREEAEGARDALEAERRRLARQLRGYGSFGRNALEEGDGLRAALLRRGWSGPGDWVARLGEVHAVLHAWRRGVADARDRYETAERIRREAEAAERRRRAAEAAARAATYSSSSYSSSSSSSSSSWGSSSSRSSSSSAGSSYSSGGRSAGSSFSSGGRSAGRRF